MPRISRPTTDLIDQPPAGDAADSEPTAAAHAAAPVAPPPTPAPAYSPGVAAALAEAEQLEFLLVELATTIARENRPATGPERLLFAKTCPGDPSNSHTLDRHIQRRVGLARLTDEFRQSAGTPSDRAADARKLKDAQQRAEKEAPAINQQIAALRSQLADLSLAVDKAQRSCDRRADAVHNLTTDLRLLPIPIKEAQTAMSRATRTERTKLQELQGRARVIRDVLSFDTSDQAKIFQWSQGKKSPVDGSDLLYHFFAPRGYDIQRGTDPPEPAFHALDLDRWRAYCKVLEAELVTVLEDLARSEHVCRTTAAEARRLQEYWLPVDAAEPAAANK